MSVFKERRIAVLLLAVFLSAMLVWSPWREVDSKVEESLGWPSKFTRGLHFGVDIIGGSRIILGLEASHVTFEIAEGDIETIWWEEIVPKLEDNLYVSIRTLSLPDPTTRLVVAEIGRSVTENLIHAIIGDLGTVVENGIKKAVSTGTVNEVTSILQARVDPTGLRGAIFRSLGENLVLFEIAGLSPEEAETLLGKPGRLEVFFEEELLLRGEDIVSVYAPGPSTEKEHTADLPFRLTDDGAERFSAAAAGKANYPTVIYIDRPLDAIVVFDNEILGELPASFRYDPDEKMFKGTTAEEIEYFLHVSAIGTATGELSPQAKQFLEEQAGFKLKVLLVGDFSLDIIENLSGLYSVKTVPRLEEESVVEWVERACGVKSVVTISPDLAADLAAGQIAKELKITVTRPSLDEAMNEARNLRVVLSERLPVEISYESERSIEARLGSEFLKEVLIAGIVALGGVWVLVYLRYRHRLIGFAIIGTMICELVITLGAASVLGWTIGLAELGGLILVIGTGVDHQIIITDEVLRGGLPQAKVMSLSGRISRAFAVIFVAVATTIAAMTLLAVVGFGAMRGFALIIITGLLIAVFVTRPAYARIVSTIVMRRRQKQ